MKTAIVHDELARRGGEQATLALLSAFLQGESDSLRKCKVINPLFLQGLNFEGINR